MKPIYASILAAALALLAAPALGQVDASSQPAQQAPAPVVRPRPIQLPSGTTYQDSFPVHTGPQGVTGSTGSTSAYRRLVLGANGSTGSTGVYRRPATGSTGSTGGMGVYHRAATGFTGGVGAAGTDSANQPQAPATPQPGPLNRTTVVLDPAHGGADSGSRLADNLVEKDVTLALAFKLRSLLQARGFNVVMTRDSDTAIYNGQAMSLDDRAGLANHERAGACLLLHATGAGTGVHLYRSELPGAHGEAMLLNWLTAQTPWVDQSGVLADRLGQALTRSGISIVNAMASVRPVDSLTCPALVLELAPKSPGDASSIMGDSYQNEVAQAIANALVFWKNTVQPPQRIPPPASAVSGSSALVSATPRARPSAPKPTSTKTPGADQ